MKCGTLQAYMPPEMLEELEREAKRQYRSVNALMRIAWLIARRQIHEAPAPELRK